MWVFTRYGFYSIACGDNPERSLDPDIIMIRARRATKGAPVRITLTPCTASGN